MTAVRPRGISETVASRLEDLVDPTGPWTLARGVVHSWLTPRAIGHGPESPGTAGRHSGHLNTGPELPGYVDPERPGTRALVAGTDSRPSRTSDKGPSSTGELVDPLGTWSRAGVPGTAGRPREPSDPSTSLLGELYDTAGPRTRARVLRYSWSTPQAQEPRPRLPGPSGLALGPVTRARVARDSWSTLRDLGHGCESSGRASQLCGNSDTGLNRP